MPIEAALGSSCLATSAASTAYLNHVSTFGRPLPQERPLNVRQSSPVFEVLIEHSVGETFPANSDTFKYTVAGQLVKHESGVDETLKSDGIVELKCCSDFL